MTRILTLPTIARAFAPDMPGGKRLLFKTRFSPGQKFECEGYEPMGWDHKVHLTLKVRPRGSTDWMYILPYEINDDAWKAAGMWAHYYERSLSKNEAEAAEAAKMLQRYAAEIESGMRSYLSADLRSIA